MIPALVRHVVESTLFAAIVAIFPLLMRKRGAAARHTLWLLAASKFAFPLALFSAAGMELRSYLPVHKMLFAGPAVLSRILSPADSAPASSGATPWITIVILGVWAGGALFMLAVWVRRYFISLGPPAAVLDTEIEALDHMKRRIGMRRKVALRSVQSEVEPGINGIWRPTITLPNGLSSSLTAREFEAVLLHELAHAKRRDNLTFSFVHALVCLFWFDPLLWWIERRLMSEQELACDELVLHHGPTQEGYAATLLKVCRFHLTGAVPSTCGITGSNLKRRMEAIMSYKLGSKNQDSFQALAWVLVMMMTVVPLAAGFFAVPVAFARTAKKFKPASAAVASKSTLTCAAGKDYPMGSVIQVKSKKGALISQQMCVEGPRGRPFWTTINSEALQRSQHIITLPAPPPVYCEPVSSPSPRYCACRTGLFSIGALVNSANGKFKLRCDKGKWQPETPKEPGKH